MNDARMKRIVKARSSLILTQPFFGALALRLRPVEAPEITKDIATNGKVLAYNPKFIDSIDDAELKAIICHEVLHCAMGHPWRRDVREFKKWNKACDYAINPIITASGMTLPKGHLDRKDWHGKNAESIYTLIQAQEEQQNKPDKNGPQDQGLPAGSVMDGNNPMGDDDEEGEGEGKGDKDGDGKGKPKPSKGDAQADAKEQEQQWKVAAAQAAQAAKLRGELPAELERMITEAIRSKVDWKSTLRRFMQQVAKNDYTWRKPKGRYMASGVYLPDMYSEAMPPVFVVIDTSGSIGQEEMNLFAGEINAIVDEAKPEKTYIAYVDAAVHGVDEFLPGEEIVLNPKGGGGTDMTKGFSYVKKEGLEPACMIFLTDGYTPFGEAQEYPVLWCMTTHGIEAPHGETLYVGDDWVQ